MLSQDMPAQARRTDGYANPRRSAPPRPATGDAPFGLDELFFSRTDPRGVIAAFNDIFLRVADYAPDAMRNAPHRLIRHEDMPRGVFRLMWDGIQSGRPVAAYVKNRARDGLSYWVLALVTPIEGGYLSVRLKPTSSLFAAVPALYADLCQRERAGLDPIASADALCAALTDMGFATYGAFQSRALALETAARDTALRRVTDGRLQALTALQSAQTGVLRHKTAITAQLALMRRVPINMRIIATRIERAGGPISAISDSYRQLSEDVMAQLAQFLTAPAPDSAFHMGATDGAVFLHCAARLAAEVGIAFAAEAVTDQGVDSAAEQARLDQLGRGYQSTATQAIEAEERAAARLLRDIASIRRALVAMDSVRIMSRVEAGRMQRRHDGLTAIVETLDSFHSRIDALLADIASEAQVIQLGAEALARRS